VVEALPFVPEHVVRRVALDHIAHPLRCREGGLLQVSPMETHIEVAEQAEHGGHGQNQENDQLPAQASSPIGRAFPERRTWVRYAHATTPPPPAQAVPAAALRPKKSAGISPPARKWRRPRR